MPFSAINYAAGASAVRVLPYGVATVAGLLPGTAAVVILGDALAGHPSPLLFLVSLCIGALGVAGLVIEIRHYRQHHRRNTQGRSSDDERCRRARRHQLTAHQLRLEAASRQIPCRAALLPLPEANMKK